MRAPVSRRRFVAGVAAAGAGLAAGSNADRAMAADNDLVGVSRAGAVAPSESPIAAALPTLPLGAEGAVVGLGSWSVLGATSMLQSFPTIGGVWGSPATVLADLVVPVGASLSAVRIFCRTTTAMSWNVEDLDLVGRVSSIVRTDATSGSGNVSLDLIGLDHVARDLHSLSIVTNDATSASSVVVGAQYWYVPVSAGYHAINPVRVYDSRLAGAQASGPLISGQARTISVANSVPAFGGTADIVTAGASAVTFNLTVTATTGRGYLGVYPMGGSFAASHINWTAEGQTIANAGNVALGGDRSVTIEAGGVGATDVIVDVTGYYR